MKIILVLIIISTFGGIGYYYKYRLNQEYMFLKYLSEFNEFYQSNIVLFKNNAIEIINNFIIVHKNKNANFNKLFLKNNNIYTYNEEILNFYIKNKDTNNIIKNYLFSIGKNDYDYEHEKNKNISSILNLKIDECYANFKNKGGLYFKLLLSIGAVIGILIW